jgi:hypothetical protein
MGEKKSGRVFIPQEPMRKIDGRMVSIMNFNNARKFGEPIILCQTGPAALNTMPTTWGLKDALRDFCDEDYLICVGDPTLIGMSSAVASNANRGKINYLKWDNELRMYIVVNFDLFQKLNQLEG